MQPGLTIAVAKGRIFEQAMPLLQHAGFAPQQPPERTRKLVIDTADAAVQLVIVRAADVATYVDYGAAQLGIVGKDCLLEHPGNGLYEPLDLGIARCRLVVAGLAHAATTLPTRPRVATKYIESARQYFAAQGQQAEIIKLYGSMELAPHAGLADLIVDLVDTGNTLRANGLVSLATVAEISSRLIVNKAAMKMQHQRLQAIIEKLAVAASICK